MNTFTAMTSRYVKNMPWLDIVAERLHAALDPVFGPDGPKDVKDALYGTWLGHPLHPLMTDLPIGFWTASILLDATGMERGADITLKAGTVSALGAAITGYAQWHDLQEMEEPKRLGVLHASLNGTAALLYAASWILRNQDRRGAGQTCAVLGYSVASASSWIGGDLSYRLGIGVSRTAFEEAEQEWTDAIADADLPEGTLTRVDLEGMPIVLLKQGDEVLAISNTCTHVGGPLDEGESGPGTVTCPWHGSEFDMRDGHVIHGPVTQPATSYETRNQGGTIQIRALAEK